MTCIVWRPRRLLLLQKIKSDPGSVFFRKILAPGTIKNAEFCRSWLRHSGSLANGHLCCTNWNIWSHKTGVPNLSSLVRPLANFKSKIYPLQFTFLSLFENQLLQQVTLNHFHALKTYTEIFVYAHHLLWCNRTRSQRTILDKVIVFHIIAAEYCNLYEVLVRQWSIPANAHLQVKFLPLAQGVI